MTLIEQWQYAINKFQGYAVRYNYDTGDGFRRTITSEEKEYCLEMANKWDGIIKELRLKIMNNENLLTQLNRLIENCNQQAEIFRENNMATSEISSQAMAQAYRNALELVKNNDEHLRFASWCIFNGLTSYYADDDAEMYIDDSKQTFLDISHVYEKFRNEK